MNKYIVKNCPVSYGLYREMCGFIENPEEIGKSCKDCPDCLIKQVIEKCKNIQKDHYWGMREIRFSQEILQLFEIEEVE